MNGYVQEVRYIARSTGKCDAINAGAGKRTTAGMQEVEYQE